MLQMEYGEALAQLRELLKVCPPLANGDLKCPASPHLTYLEFLLLFDNLQKNLVQEELQAVIAGTPKKIEGTPHLVCPLLRNGFCLAMGGQGVFCHLGEDLSRCVHLPPERVEEIFLKLSEISVPLHENLTEPYYLNMLNFHCWIAVMLDHSITQPLFVSLREQMKKIFSVTPLLPHYQNHTRLNEKLALIDCFFQLNADQRAVEALACMERVRNDFPFTGAYYGPQADAYIQFMQELLKVVKQKSHNV